MQAFIWIRNSKLPNYSIFDQPKNMISLSRRTVRKKYHGCQQRFHEDKKWRNLQLADGYGEQIMEQIDSWNIRNRSLQQYIFEIPQDHMEILMERAKDPSTETTRNYQNGSKKREYSNSMPNRHRPRKLASHQLHRRSAITLHFEGEKGAGSQTPTRIGGGASRLRRSPYAMRLRDARRCSTLAGRNRSSSWGNPLCSGARDTA